MDRLKNVLVSAAVVVFFIVIVFPCALVSVPAGLVPLLILEKLGAPASCEIAVFVLVFAVLSAVLFEVARRALLKTDTVMEDSPRSRLQSVGLWLVPGFLLWLFFFALALYYERDAFLLGLPAVLILAAAAGVVFPFKRHRNTPVFGCAGPLFAFLLFCIGAVLIGRTGLPVDYTGDSPAGIPHLTSRQRENYFPAGASEIRVRGTTAAFEWTCRLAEKDFLDYAKKGRFSFRKAGQTERFDIAVPYYEYENRRPDGGGLTLRYSLPEKKFYGFYADH